MLGRTHLHRSSESDKDTIANWVSDYGKDVWNFVFALTRSPELTDDIVQDVFIRAYRHMHAFRGESTVKTWLLKIARNAVYDYRKSAFKRRVVLVDPPIDGMHPSAETEALNHMVEEKIWTLVLRLPIKLREVLILHAHHQLSNAEIADALNISTAAVQTRLHRARKAMIELVKEGDEDAEG